LGELDWEALVSIDGENRIEHIEAHMKPMKNKRLHSVFNLDYNSIISTAWNDRNKSIPKISKNKSKFIYNIPYPNAGYESGRLGTGKQLNFVTIVVAAKDEKPTNKIVTAYPSDGTID